MLCGLRNNVSVGKKNDVFNFWNDFNPESFLELNGQNRIHWRTDPGFEENANSKDSLYIISICGYVSTVEQ